MDSELQLNIKTVKQKHHNASKKALSQSKYSFVSKPVMAGKTIAKIRKKSNRTNTNDNYSFLTAPDNAPKEKTDEPAMKVKKMKAGKEKEEDSDLDMDLSINIKNTPEKKIRSKGSNLNEGDGGQQPKISSGNLEPRKRSIQSHISSLFRNNPDIPVLGQRFVKPINEKVFSGKNFQDLDVHSFTVSNLEKNMGLKQMTVVQQKACPVILQGRDVLVRSQTGSGKTLAYALPIVEALQAIRPKLKRQDGIRALVIVPTRELALQTYELFIKLVRSFTWIVPGYLIGGEKRKAEKARIRKGFNILIGTPGRVCDHIQHTASLTLGKVRCLVLDEADRLLDMGYEKDVSSIVDTLKKHVVQDKYDPMAIVRQSVRDNHIHFSEESGDDSQGDSPSKQEKLAKDSDASDVKEEYRHALSNVFESEKRQTVLLSATLTKAVETLAGLTMEDPVFIDASEGRATVIADSLVSKDATSSHKSTDNVVEEVENEENDEFEIVPQPDSDDSEHSESEDSSDSQNSDSEDEEQVDKSKLSIYKGLKAFTGLKPDKKEKTKKKKAKVESPKQNTREKPAKTNDEASDSDSDYDFFAVSKVDIKTSSDEVKPSKKHKPDNEDKIEMDTKILTKSGSYENPFQNALQSAIVQDEMVIPSSVTQLYILTPMKLRLVTLSALIIEKCVTPGSGKMLIFMATQDMIDYHCDLLSRTLAGRKPHHIHVQDNTYSKRTKKYMKRKQNTNDCAESHDEADETEPSKEPQTDDKLSDDEYEYNFDSMDLADYEAKRRAEKAFVNVDFFQLHGSMNQKTRTEIFNTFRKASSGVLLCTSKPLRKPPKLKISNHTRTLVRKYIKCHNDLNRFSKAYRDHPRSVFKTHHSKISSEMEDIKRHIQQNEPHLDVDNFVYSVMKSSSSVRHSFRDHKSVSCKRRLSCVKLEESMDVSNKRRVLNNFCRYNSSVLFCTDVAARGLDLPHVDCIVQYTGPISVTDYVHRVGRTARAGNVGVAIMILLPSELEFVRQLEARRIRLYQEDMEVSHKALLKNTDKRNVKSGGGPSPIQLAAAELQQNYEELVKSDKELYTKACKAFTSWLRFYSTYPREARVAFDRKTLHIGHAATALALTDTPKKIGKEAPKPVNRKDSDLKRRAEREKSTSKVKHPSAKYVRRENKIVVSEFESGLEPPKKKHRVS